MPTSPSQFFRLAHEHLALLLKIHERGSISDTELSPLLSPHTRQQLLQSQLLEITPQADTHYELSQPLSDLFHWLRKSQQITSADALQGYFIELSEHGRTLDLAIRNQNLNEAILSLQRLERTLERLRSLSDANREAITTQAQQLKATPQSLQTQFESVRFLWERFLIPLRELITVDGLMERTLTELADILQSAADTFASHPLARQFEHTQARRARLKSSMAHDHTVAICEITPLYERLRRDSRYVQGASYALSILRRDGIAPLKIDPRLGLFSIQTRNLMADERLRARFAALAQYQPSPPPPLPEAEPPPTTQHIPRQLLHQTLQTPQEDILACLIAHWPQASLSAILEAYGHLYSEGHLSPFPSDIPRSYPHPSGQLHAFPHRYTP